MKLIDLITAPWAILPDRLVEIQGIYATHLRGEKIDIDAIEARLGRPLANDQQEYAIRDGGVAVLPIDGAIAPKANLFTRVSGGASAQLLTKQVESAIVDPRVKALVLAIDSPGGSVFGTPELAATVRELATVKPIVAVTDGTMASAAYWIGSAANAVFASGPTVQVGSIGVVAGHTYTPPGASQTTEITAGRYKRIATGSKPLTEEGAAYLQSQVDHLYQVFVDAVAINRGTTPDAVLQHMADGRIFIGQQALDAGLIDGFSTVDQIVAQLAADPSQFASRRKAVLPGQGKPAKKPAGARADGDPTEPVLLASETPQERIPMDRATLEQQHPALFAQLQSDFRTEGASAERQRITDVRAQSLSGHEALIETMAFDGKTTGPEAAAAVLAAERSARSAAAAAHAADAPKPAPAAAAPADAPKTRAVMAAEAEKLAKDKGIDIVAAFKELGYA